MPIFKSVSLGSCEPLEDRAWSKSPLKALVPKARLSLLNERWLAGLPSASVRSSQALPQWLGVLRCLRLGPWAPLPSPPPCTQPPP